MKQMMALEITPMAGANLDYWDVLESATSARMLGVAWINQWDVRSIRDVRRKLASKQLRNVGAAREFQVSESLRLWRESVMENLLGSTK